MPVGARRAHATPDIWPGFVDAISALLIIVIFLLMVFTLAQYFLSAILSGRDEALERLNRQIIELSEMLSLERNDNAALRLDLSQVSAQLQASSTARDRLSSQLAEILPDRDALSASVAELTRERETFSALLAERTRERDALALQAGNIADQAHKSAVDLESAFKTIEADTEKIALQLRRIASMERDVETLGELRKKLEKEVALLGATIKAKDTEFGALRDRSKELAASLATEQERTSLAQKTIDETDIRLRDTLARAGRTELELTEEQKLSAAAQRRVNLLNAQLAALRQQLARIAAALEISETKSREQNVQIVDLGRRLNMALASKVEELARFRSEFFGRLRKALGSRRDIRIVGDRFVLQSEVLFGSGSATLQAGGRRQILRIAQTLLDISRKIPREINWVLRVDGHTDRIPIKTPRFPSNWELSTGRAISVVRFLVEQGVPARRLAVTGFGEFQPLDTRNDEIAFRRNRRIEFKLTER